MKLFRFTRNAKALDNGIATSSYNQVFNGG